MTVTVSNNPNAIATYLACDVASADPSQIIVLLYEGAIYRIGQAVQEMEKQNALAAGIAIYRALAIVGELRKSLNLEEGARSRVIWIGSTSICMRSWSRDIWRSRLNRWSASAPS